MASSPEYLEYVLELLYLSSLVGSRAVPFMREIPYCQMKGNLD
jgi:hypothetical protein